MKPNTKNTKTTARKKYFAKLIDLDSASLVATFEVIGDYSPEPAAICCADLLGGASDGLRLTMQMNALRVDLLRSLVGIGGSAVLICKGDQPVDWLVPCC